MRGGCFNPCVGSKLLPSNPVQDTYQELGAYRCQRCAVSVSELKPITMARRYAEGFTDRLILHRTTANRQIATVCRSASSFWQTAVEDCQAVHNSKDYGSRWGETSMARYRLVSQRRTIARRLAVAQRALSVRRCRGLYGSHVANSGYVIQQRCCNARLDPCCFASPAPSEKPPLALFGLGAWTVIANLGELTFNEAKLVERTRRLFYQLEPPAIELHQRRSLCRRQVLRFEDLGSIEMVLVRRDADCINI